MKTMRSGSAALALMLTLAVPGAALAGLGDTDDDGVLDTIDNCINDANPGQLNLDGDGLGDACDDDRDADSKTNGGDNCPDASNLAQLDIDGDGVGDKCDALATELKPTGRINVGGMRPVGVAGVNTVVAVRSFQVLLQNINIQKKVTLHVGTVETDEERYRKITTMQLKGWPPSASKTVIVALPDLRSLSSRDAIVVTVGAPQGALLEKDKGYFKNSIMAGKMRSFT